MEIRRMYWNSFMAHVVVISTIFAVSIHLTTASSSTNTKKPKTFSASKKSHQHHERVIRQVEKLAGEEHVESRRKCTHSSREKRYADRSPRSPRYEIRSANRGDFDFGMALYFTGQSDLLRRSIKNLGRVEYPTEQFSVELWVKPEGGQKSPAVIIGKGILFHQLCYKTNVYEDSIDHKLRSCFDVLFNGDHYNVKPDLKCVFIFSIEMICIIYGKAVLPYPNAYQRYYCLPSRELTNET